MDRALAPQMSYKAKRSITSRRRRHRVARPPLNLGRRPVHSLAHLRRGASSPPRARAIINGSEGSVPGRRDSRPFFHGCGRVRRGDHRRVRGRDDAFRTLLITICRLRFRRRESRQRRPTCDAAHRRRLRASSPRLGPCRPRCLGGRRAPLSLRAAASVALRRTPTTRVCDGQGAFDRRTPTTARRRT